MLDTGTTVKTSLPLAIPFFGIPNVKTFPEIEIDEGVAEDKVAIIETIFANTRPSGFSGSLAQILEVRSKAFSELLNHSDKAVRDVASAKLQELKRMTEKEKETEANEKRRGEQTFE